MELTIPTNLLCPFCGSSLSLVNRPWLDGDAGWEIEHVDLNRATDMKCPMVMSCYDTAEEAIKALALCSKREIYVQNIDHFYSGCHTKITPVVETVDQNESLIPRSDISAMLADVVVEGVDISRLVEAMGTK